MPTSPGLSRSPVCCCNFFPRPSCELGVAEEGPIVTLSPLVGFPRGRLRGISDSDSDALARTSELSVGVEKEDPKAAMKHLFMLPQMTEIGLCAADCAPFNPLKEFCGSPRARLLAKLEVDIGKETQMKLEKRRRRQGATFKEVKLGKCSVDPEAPVWVETATTVMVRNIPNSYTVEEFLVELRADNFEGLFDFMYFPIDFLLKENKGYAFINFHNPCTRARFASVFDRRALTRYATREVLRVVPAATQGFEANMAKYTM